MVSLMTTIWLRAHDAMILARLPCLGGKEHLHQTEGGAIPADEVAVLLHLTQ